MKHLQIILFGDYFLGSMFTIYSFVDEKDSLTIPCPDLNCDFVASESDEYLSVNVFLSSNTAYVSRVLSLHMISKHGYTETAPIEYEMFRRRAQNLADTRYAAHTTFEKNIPVFNDETSPVSLYAYRGGLSDEIFEHPLMINREYLIYDDLPCYFADKNRSYYGDTVVENTFNIMWREDFGYEEKYRIPSFILWAIGPPSHNFNDFFLMRRDMKKLIYDASKQYVDIMEGIGVLK